MMKINRFISFLILTVFLISCASSDRAITGRVFQKRKYQKGYYFKNIIRGSTNTYVCSEEGREEYDNGLLVSTEVMLVVKEPVFELDSFSLFSDSLKCDLVIFENGEETKAKVTEVTETSIKYIKCDNLDGPSYTVDKQNVFMIQYANGSRELIRKDNEAIREETEVEEEERKGTKGPISNLDFQTDKKEFGVKKSGSLGVLAFITSIVSLFVFSLLLSPGAIALGIIGARRNRKRKGLAIAGIIIGSIVFLLSLILLASS